MLSCTSSINPTSTFLEWPLQHHLNPKYYFVLRNFLDQKHYLLHKHPIKSHYIQHRHKSTMYLFLLTATFASPPMANTFIPIAANLQCQQNINIWTASAVFCLRDRRSFRCYCVDIWYTHIIDKIVGLFACRPVVVMLTFYRFVYNVVPYYILNPNTEEIILFRCNVWHHNNT